MNYNDLNTLKAIDIEVIKKNLADKLKKIFLQESMVMFSKTISFNIEIKGRNLIIYNDKKMSLSNVNIKCEGERNIIYIGEQCIINNMNIDIRGNNNKLFIGNKVHIDSLYIKLYGDTNNIIFKNKYRNNNLISIITKDKSFSNDLVFVDNNSVRMTKKIFNDFLIKPNELNKNLNIKQKRKESFYVWTFEQYLVHKEKAKNENNVVELLKFLIYTHNNEELLKILEEKFFSNLLSEDLKNKYFCFYFTSKNKYLEAYSHLKEIKKVNFLNFDLASISAIFSLEDNINNLDSIETLRDLYELGFIGKNKGSTNVGYSYFINDEMKIVYCSIPKNACTQLQHFLLSNSSTDEEFKKSKKSIHNFLGTTKSKIRLKNRNLHALNYLKTNEYKKIVVIRDPIERVVSGYLDKFAKRKNPEIFAKKVIANVCRYKEVEINIDNSITFAEFVDYLVRTPDKDLDYHWRPQYCFVGGVKFDLYIDIKKLNIFFNYVNDNLKCTLEENVSHHKTNYLNVDTGLKYKDMLPFKLRLLGYYPSLSLLCNDEIISKLSERYKKDILLYEKTKATFDTKLKVF